MNASGIRSLLVLVAIGGIVLLMMLLISGFGRPAHRIAATTAACAREARQAGAPEGAYATCMASHGLPVPPGASIPQSEAPPCVNAPTVLKYPANSSPWAHALADCLRRTGESVDVVEHVDAGGATTYSVRAAP